MCGPKFYHFFLAGDTQCLHLQVSNYYQTQFPTDHPAISQVHLYSCLLRKSYETASLLLVQGHLLGRYSSKVKLLCYKEVPFLQVMPSTPLKK